MLNIEDLTVKYDKNRAIDSVSIEVEHGEIITLIGANGAGKTTILKAISGISKIVSGKIWFGKKRIDNCPTQDIIKLGIAHAPEGRRLFNYMSVKDTLLTGAFLIKSKDNIKRYLERVYTHFPRLKERENQNSETLSGGEQQMLSIGRALMSNPKLLLLDEPTLGLAPKLVVEIAKIIRDINNEGVAVVLVEQNANMALKLAKRAYVMEVGKVVLEGESKQLHEDPRVRKAYLGG